MQVGWESEASDRRRRCLRCLRFCGSTVSAASFVSGLMSYEGLSYGVP